MLGITTETDNPEQVKEKWFALLKGTDINPVDLHSMLWNRSRNDFVPKV